MKRGLAVVATALLTACGGPPVTPAAPQAPSAAAAPPIAAAPGPAPAAPDVELRDAKSAIVGGGVVPVDGVAEGLAWPALVTATKRRSGDHTALTMTVAREVPMSTVMRAVWTLRDADVRLQTADAAGAIHVLDLRPKPEAASTEGCHLAVFVAPNGDLRVAAPGGQRAINGPDAPANLARALASERARCAIRYVAFGAETQDAPWGSVFDVAWAVDQGKSAGDARYVLAEPVRIPAR